MLTLSTRVRVLQHRRAEVSVFNGSAMITPLFLLPHGALILVVQLRSLNPSEEEDEGGDPEHSSGVLTIVSEGAASSSQTMVDICLL